MEDFSKSSERPKSNDIPKRRKLISGPADVLTYESQALPRRERELIATYVSAVNDCVYCQTIHGLIAAQYWDDDGETVLQVTNDFQNAPISEKLKTLLTIAGKVRAHKTRLTTEDLVRARKRGATDLEIYDTVLIAEMFCMCAGKWMTSRIERCDKATTRSKRRPRTRLT